MNWLRSWILVHRIDGRRSLRVEEGGPMEVISRAVHVLLCYGPVDSAWVVARR